ncbi:helix-turn-helix domain-containing protein [Enterococcus sp. HY326]|uniref:helix-turn-helix domain-containing protein n=1 Tax=Enterococcus sp. HY326 TaxID=2971265 RepID=UPI002240DAAC|nr:helix-turn-helix transcriptional regulator [Enterococcus sp. HY326]
MAIGNNIAHQRKNMAWTQKDLATLMHVSDKTISSWENERTYPDISSLVLLSDIFELSLDELIKGDLDMVKRLDKNLQEGQKWRKWRWLIIITSLLVVGFILLNIAWLLWTNHRQSELDNYSWETEEVELPEGLSNIGYYVKSDQLYVYLSSYQTKYSTPYLDFEIAPRVVTVSDGQKKSLVINEPNKIIFYNGEGSYINLNNDLEPLNGKASSDEMTKNEVEIFYTTYQEYITSFYEAGITVFSDLN